MPVCVDVIFCWAPQWADWLARSSIFLCFCDWPCHCFISLANRRFQVIVKRPNRNRWMLPRWIFWRSPLTGLPTPGCLNRLPWICHVVIGGGGGDRSIIIHGPGRSRGEMPLGLGALIVYKWAYLITDPAPHTPPPVRKGRVRSDPTATRILAWRKYII